MGLANTFYLEGFGKAFVPKKFRPYLRRFFLKAGYDEVPFTTFGILFWVSAVLTYTAYVPFIYPMLKELNFAVFFFASFASWFVTQACVAGLLSFFFYFNLNVKIYQRTKLLEEKLPEYLSLVSINLKGGMAFERSLWLAIKPEFGILAREITMVSKSVMTGNDVKGALQEFSDKYDSPVLKRTIDLLIGELEGGGKIVDVIDGLIDQLKKARMLKNELRVATTTYMIFISTIVIFMAPALFAVSYQLLEIMTGFSSGLVGTGQTVNLPFSFGGTNVQPIEFKKFSYFALTIISMFSSMIISIIEKGDIRGGLKYIPVFVSGSVFFYFIFSALMGFLFSSFTF